jgi:hypothetical protein
MEVSRSAREHHPQLHNGSRPLMEVPRSARDDCQTCNNSTHPTRYFSCSRAEHENYDCGGNTTATSITVIVPRGATGPPCVAMPEGCCSRAKPGKYDRDINNGYRPARSDGTSMCCDARRMLFPRGAQEQNADLK